MPPEIETIVRSIELVIPAVTLLVVGCLFLALAAFVPYPDSDDKAKSWRSALAVASIGTLALAWFFAFQRSAESLPLASGLFRLESITKAGEGLSILGGFLIILLGWNAAPRKALAEYYGCLLILLSGLMFVGAANDLTSLFLSLELISIPTIVLLTLTVENNRGWEAALKYFTLSAFSSAFFLLGLSYLYGLSGSTDLPTIQKALGNNPSNLATLAVLLTICGLSFRVTAVPFHFYAPDVFEGASISLAALLAYLPKVAGFLAMVRLLGDQNLLAPLGASATTGLLVLAAITMCLGNGLALLQTSTRRLLAYSSIAHTGYLLFGVAALLDGGQSPVAISSYLAAYAVMTLGVFAGLAGLENSGRSAKTIEDLGGLAYYRPMTALTLSICLLSLIGLPLTAGFWAKLQIFIAAVSSKNPQVFGVAILMGINSAIAAAYYLRVLAKIWEKRTITEERPGWSPPIFVACGVCAALTLVWFFAPQWL